MPPAPVLYSSILSSYLLSLSNRKKAVASTRGYIYAAKSPERQKMIRISRLPPEVLFYIAVGK